MARRPGGPLPLKRCRPAAVVCSQIKCAPAHGKMLASLDLAFQRKGRVLKGGQMPDPRADPSFDKYVRDDDFVKLMKTLGLK
jgi:hypothetical protein